MPRTSRQLPPRSTPLSPKEPQLRRSSNEYDPFTLSEAEMTRLLSALGDGFGYSQRHHREQQQGDLALPAEVEPGLLKHQFHYYKAPAPPDYCGEDPADEFWGRFDDDSPPGLFEDCPVNFWLPEIRTYFREQRAAYIQYVQNHDELRDELASDQETGSEEILYCEVLCKTYSKAWYEFHINQHIFVIENITESFRSPAGPRNVARRIDMLINYSARLGRLIEQYYWKFLVEKAAIRGEKISQSAKAGGLLRAAMLKHEHAPWQALANQIWRQNPKHQKMTVASIVKKRLKLNQTAKHIAGVLKQP
jgi:hypothetical protein